MSTGGRVEPQVIRVGCAGWSIPRVHADRFAPGASHLTRYATRFAAVEIDSSFYRPHRAVTYARWADTTPDTFRFAIKAPRAITHERRLVDTTEPLERFLTKTAALGEKRGPLLIQLPPSLVFDPAVAAAFWRELRARYGGEVVCEPRHPSWFRDEADRLLQTWEVARVAADPPPVPQADAPGGWAGLRYLRLHGSPRVYYDAYDDPSLDRLAGQLVEGAQDAPVWCIFDNTASGAATLNAVRLLDLLHDRHVHP